MAPPQTKYNKQNIVIPETPNTKIYRDLSRTDPNATKPFQKKGGFQGTAIDPAWRWMRLTEYFGPCGQGWGAEQLAFHIAEGIAFVCVRLWYRVPNEDGSMGTGEQCWTPPQWGGSELIKVQKGYTVTSDEALKMAMTDAMGKCAGMYLGLGADIYLGSFEDDKYREESEHLYSIKANSALLPQAIAKSEADLAEKLAEITDLKDLDDLWKGGINARIHEIGTANKEARQRMISAFTAKKNELLALQNDKPNEPEPEGHPKIQEEADQGQGEDRGQHEQAEVEAKLEQPAKTASDELTPEKIRLFKEWVGRKLPAMKDKAELDALWKSTCEERMIRIKALDPKVHKEISDTYVKYHNQLGGKGGGNFKRVSNQDS
jgi:hypothetical protein